MIPIGFFSASIKSFLKWVSITSSSFQAGSLSGPSISTSNGFISLNMARNTAEASASAGTCIVAYDDSGNVLSQKRLKTPSSYNYAYSNLTRDSSGNLYFAVTVAESPQKYVLVKVDSAFSLVWAKTISLPSSYIISNIPQIAADSSGNIYVAFASYISGSFESTHAIRILKLDASGAVVWQKQFPVSGSGSIFTTNPLVAIDSAGNLIISSMYTKDPYSSASYVVKVNSSGVVQWAKFFSNGYRASATKVVIGPSDSIYITGSTEYSSIFRASVLGISSSGALIFDTNVANSDNSTGVRFNDCVADSSGNVYVFGYHVNDKTLRVIKFSSSGSLVWSKTISTSVTLSTGQFVPDSIILSADQSSVIVKARMFTTPSRVVTFKIPVSGSISGSHVVDSITYTFSTSSDTYSGNSYAPSSVSLTIESASGYSLATYSDFTQDDIALSTIVTEIV